MENIDLSLFEVDMHSHLIPGIDDGSKSLDESIALLAKFESLGYKKVITTPHIMSDYYKNTPEIIKDGLFELKEAASRLNIFIEVEAAAEYYFDDFLLKRLENKERLLTFGENFVLFEFGFNQSPNHIEKLFFELLTQNYQPILAHFERYAWLFGSVEKAFEWREKGINIQLNLNSLTGQYGPEVKRQAEKLVDSGQIDFVGTDCHRIEHLLVLENNLNLPYFHKLTQLKLKNPLLV